MFYVNEKEPLGCVIPPFLSKIIFASIYYSYLYPKDFRNIKIIYVGYVFRSPKLSLIYKGSVPNL